MGIENYSTNAASNNAASPNGFKEGMLPSEVNNVGRQVMADIRSWYESAEWIDFGDAPTFASVSSFTVAGDKTAEYVANRRIKISDSSDLYGYVTSSSFSSPNTTVNVELDSGSLSVSISKIYLNIIKEPILNVFYNKKIFSGDDVTTSFALDAAPASENALLVYINGVIQEPASAFSISGNNVVFSSAPPRGENNIIVIDISAKAVVNVPADGSITEGKLASNSVTSGKVPDNALPFSKLAQFSAKKVLGNMGISSASGAEISVLDEDDFASDSEEALATQKSIKAYIDAEIAKLAFTSSITGDGYITFPNGLTIQWGKDNSVIGVNGTATVTFPIPFTEIYSVNLTGEKPANNDNPHLSTTSPTTTSFIIQAGGSGVTGVHWMAIGKIT